MTWTIPQNWWSFMLGVVFGWSTLMLMVALIAARSKRHG
jgi:hypothetical protein